MEDVILVPFILALSITFLDILSNIIQILCHQNPDLFYLPNMT
jgi:hypothetical protein